MVRSIFLRLSLLSVIFLVIGCGGGGDDSTVFTPAATNNAGGGGQTNLNSTLNGRYGLLSAGIGATRSIATGTVVLDGAGGVSEGSGTIFVYNPVTGGVTALASTITSGFYNVDNQRVFTGEIVTDDGTVTSIVNGGISSNDVFAGANWQDSNQASGQFLIIRTVANPTNASLAGTYRFSIAQVGLFEGYSFGTVEFDGAGNIIGGRIDQSNGNFDLVVGGDYQVADDGSVTGTLSAGGITTRFSGYLGEDLTLGVSTSDDFGNLGLGIATPGPAVASSTADLSGAYRFLAIRTSPATGRGFATGSIDAAGGNFTGGSVLYSDGSQAAITGGTYDIQANGIFSPTTAVFTSNDVTTQTDFMTLHRDGRVASGVIRDSVGNQGIALLVR